MTIRPLFNACYKTQEVALPDHTDEKGGQLVYPLLSWVTLGENWCLTRTGRTDLVAVPARPGRKVLGPPAEARRRSSHREAHLTDPFLGVRKTRTNATEEPCSSCIRAAHALPDELPE